MAQFLISLTGVLILAGLAWGIAALLLGRDPGLEPAEPDGRAVPLPAARPLTESDLGVVRFDIAARGYRMLQVDSALRRAAYDIGYKEELIGVLEAEVAALREGRLDEAEALRQAREAASRPRVEPAAEERFEPVDDVDTDTQPVVLGTFEIGAGPTIGALPGEPPAEAEPADASTTADVTPAVGPEPEADANAEPELEPAGDAAPEAATTPNPGAKPRTNGRPKVNARAKVNTKPVEEPEPEAAEPDDIVDSDAEPYTAPAEPVAAAEPDDSVDTDLAPVRTAASDRPAEANPADGDR